MPIYLTGRVFNTVAFLACALLLAFAYYQQFYVGLEPCPLCIFQRIVFIALGIVFIVSAAHGDGPIRSRIHATLLGLMAGTGASIAAWHVRLQHLPAGEVPECGPGLDYMLDALPLTQALKMAFTGSGECAEVVWSLLGLSMPSWALVWFVLLGTAGVWINWRSGRSPSVH